MDVAIRASQILASEGFLRGAGDDRFWADLLKSLLLHARFILDNLESGPVRGNHYVSNLAGLYLCGLGLTEFREAPKWREFARERLFSEMQRQVTGDGLDYEASLSYHAFVTEMFLFPALMESEKGGSFCRPYLEILEKMIEAVAILIRPDGTLPQIPDVLSILSPAPRLEASAGAGRVSFPPPSVARARGRRLGGRRLGTRRAISPLARFAADSRRLPWLPLPCLSSGRDLPAGCGKHPDGGGRGMRRAEKQRQPRPQRHSCVRSLRLRPRGPARSGHWRLRP